MFIQTVLALYAIVFMLTAISLSLPTVFGQAQPAQTTITGVNTGNLKLQEQKGWLYIEPPAGQNIPSAQNFGSGDNMGTILGIVSTGLALYSNYQNKKVKEVQKNQGEIQVQQATVQKESLKLQYDTMGEEKANAINNRPEIQLKEVEKIEKKAVETASKA